MSCVSIWVFWIYFLNLKRMSSLVRLHEICKLLCVPWILLLHYFSNSWIWIYWFLIFLIFCYFHCTDLSQWLLRMVEILWVPSDPWHQLSMQMVLRWHYILQNSVLPMESSRWNALIALYRWLRHPQAGIHLLPHLHSVFLWFLFLI